MLTPEQDEAIARNWAIFMLRGIYSSAANIMNNQTQLQPHMKVIRVQVEKALEDLGAETHLQRLDRIQQELLSARRGSS